MIDGLFKDAKVGIMQKIAYLLLKHAAGPLTSSSASLPQGFSEIASLCSFCLFLLDGKYYNWSERLTGMRLVYRERGSGTGSYESTAHLTDRYFNHSLMLEYLSKLISAILPLLRIHRFVKFISRLVMRRKKKLPLHDDDKDDKVVSCRICKSESMLYAERLNPCGHKFCYHCIESHRLCYLDGNEQFANDDENNDIVDDDGIDKDASKGYDEFPCPYCDTMVQDRKMTFFTSQEE